MNIYIEVLGCPKSEVDAERLSYFLINNDHKIVYNPEEADIIIINSCGFIEKAKQETIDTIFSFLKYKTRNPDLKIILSGCLSERYKDEIHKLIPEIDSSIGIKDQSLILEAIKTNKKTFIDSIEYRDYKFSKERTLTYSKGSYSYLKVSEGCNKSCSFCAIPLIRGKQRSRDINNIIEEARLLKDNGIKELIIISEDTLSYGMDLYNKRILLNLLDELQKLDFKKIRLMYLYPEDYLIEIVKYISQNNNFCRYIDVPLQHCNEDILRSMQRYGNTKYYLNLFEKIRSIIPDISIRSAFITGYPSENEEQFNELVEFLKIVRFDNVGFFEYSDEENTLAHKLKPKVKKSIIKKRIKYLYNIQKEISLENLKKYIGKILNCIWDGQLLNIKNREYYIFRSEYNAPEIDSTILVKTNNEIIDLDFYSIKITDIFDEYTLLGEFYRNS